MATVLLDPGGDATGDTSFLLNSNVGGAGNTAVAASTTQKHGTHTYSYLFSNASGSSYCEMSASLAAASGRLNCFIYITAYPSAQATIMVMTQTGLGAAVYEWKMSTTGQIGLWNSSTAQLGSFSAALPLNTWHRLSMAYSITSTTVNTQKLWVDGINVVSSVNATLTNITPVDLLFGNAGGNGENFFGSDFYADNSAALTDPGNIWVTAKRPFANGTTNGFTTQVGAGGSGYGTGHASQVNERPLSTTNGWSLNTASAITEEYTIESQGQGDIDMTDGQIIDYMGWVDAASTLSETSKIIVGGVSSNISTTSAATIFQKIAGSTVYPLGGTDIGMISAAVSTTYDLYECGLVFAFIPNAGNSITSVPPTLLLPTVNPDAFTPQLSTVLPIHLIQTVRIAASANPLTFKFGQPLTAGSTVMLIFYAVPSDNVSNVTDTSGNTYSVINANNAVQHWASFWYAPNIKAGSPTISANHTGGNNFVVLGFEWAGLSVSPLDTHASNFNSSASVTAQYTGAITTNYSVELIMYWLGSSGSSATAPSTLNFAQNASGSSVVAAAWQIAYTKGTFSNTFTTSSSTYGAGVAGFATVPVPAMTGDFQPGVLSNGSPLLPLLNPMGFQNIGGTPLITTHQYTQSFSGGLSFAGSFGPTTTNKALTANLTFTGNLNKAISKLLTAASLSFTGAFVKQINKILASAALSFSGAIKKVVGKSLTATLSFTGALSKAIFKLMTAALTFTGSLLKAISKLLAATLSFTGSFVKQLQRAFAAALSFTGSISQIRIFNRSFIATLSFTGAMSRAISKLLAATLSFAGLNNRFISKNLVAAAMFNRGVGLYFNGGNVKAPASTGNLSTSLSAVSISLWILMETPTGTATTLRIMAKNNTGDSGNSVYDLFYGANNIFGTRITNASGTSAAQNSNNIGTLADGTWHNLIMTYDGTTINFYHNGVNKGTFTQSLGALAATNGGVWFATSGFSAGPLKDIFLSDARIYSRALSSAEATAMYTGAVVSNANLEAQWLFNDGNGTSAADNTGNGYTGTLGGAPTPVWSVGQITAYQSLQRNTSKFMSATLSFAGSFAKQINKTLSGALSFTGSFSPKNIFKALTASLSFTGKQNNAISKQLVPAEIMFNNWVYNFGFEYAPPFTAATNVNARWIDGTAGGSTSNAVYGWALHGSGTFAAQFDNTTSEFAAYSMHLATQATASQLSAESIISSTPTNLAATAIPATPNTKYILSGWMKTAYTSGDSNDGAFIAAVTYDNTGAAQQTLNTTKVKTTTGWTFYSTTFTTSATVAYINVSLRIYGHTGTATLIMDAWFDDINVDLFNGQLIKAIAKAPFTATLSFTGAFSKGLQYLRSFTGSLSFSGAISKQISKLVSGALTFTGSYTHAISKLMTGSLSFTGNLSKQIAKTLTAAALSFSGAITKQIGKLLTGTLSFSGAIKRFVGKLVSGNLTFTGAQNRSVGKHMAASVSFSGSLSRRIAKSISGALSFAGSISKRIGKNVGGALSFSGNVTTFHFINRALTGTLSFAGSLSRLPNKALTATLSFTGSISKVVVNKILRGLKNPIAQRQDSRTTLGQKPGNISVRSNQRVTQVGQKDGPENAHVRSKDSKINLE